MTRVMAERFLTWCCLGLAALVATAYSYQETDPMVAFMCNRPAMYRTADGWIKDDSSDCLEDPVDILNYCRKVYPNHDVRNVVESSKKATIEKWCGFGHNRCHHEYTVRPFRCLVGAFQSNALLVPEHCLFDHISNSRECKTFDQWNQTAAQSCVDRGMAHQSFDILQPCGVDRFSGVEFVCCPEEDDVDQFLHQEMEWLTSSTQLPSTTDGRTSSLPTTPSTPPTPAPTPTTTSQGAAQEPTSATPSNIYEKYLHNAAGLLNEHEYFSKAKTELEKHHHEKVTKMMKEWAEARQHVQEVKAVDPKGASKLNKEITTRFQKTYEALEQEGISEKKQLVALHQQRVQAALNEKKRHAMERYMDILTDQDIDPAHVLKALQHYIKAEEKDRLHSINHFKHLKDSDPAEAEAVREQTLNHLELIEARIQQALEMLNRVPNYQKKIRTQIDLYLSTFQPLDASVNKLLQTPILVEPLVNVLGPVDVAVDYPDIPLEPSTSKLPDTPSPRQPLPTEVSTASVERTVAPSPARVLFPEVARPQEIYDEEVTENEHDIVPLNHPLHGDSFRDNRLEVDSGFVSREAVRRFSAPTLAVAIGSVTVFIVIVVGIVVLRKRAQRVPPSHGFVEVDTAASASPEERHVTNMQLNGYENPTYKYFEMNGNA